MIAPPMRMITAALAHATYGVNAQLATLPADAGDPTIGTLTIADQVSNSQVAVGRPTKRLPMLSVSFVDLEDLNPTVAVAFPEAKPRYLIRYHGESTHADQLVLESFQVMWAVIRCLRVLFQTADQADRTRNGIVLMENTQCSVGMVQSDIEGEPATAGVLVVPQVHDTTP